MERNDNMVNPYVNTDKETEINIHMHNMCHINSVKSYGVDINSNIFHIPLHMANILIC